MPKEIAQNLMTHPVDWPSRTNQLSFLLLHDAMKTPRMTINSKAKRKIPGYEFHFERA
jgi:hypothetical protein